ncbi:hypothetical protein BO204_005290, partial [Escherichia coli]|nr:hypothetical protein [Escherichia coli]
WFGSLASGDMKDWHIEMRSTYSQTIGEALAGNGIALGSVALLRSELDSGRLVRISSDTLRTNRGYFLCHDEQSSLSDDASRLAEFLIQRAASPQENGASH